MNQVYSRVKFTDYFVLLKEYENTLSLHGNLKKLPFENIPLEYQYLINKRKFEVLDYYRHNLLRFFEKSVNKNDVNSALYVFFEKKLAHLPKNFINNISQNDFYKNLESRRQTSFVFSSLHRGDSRDISMGILQFYSKAYEITEFLYIWKWITNIIHNEELEETFCKFKDRRGEIIKGNLYRHILSKLKEYPKVQKIIQRAYNNKLRNQIDHNNIDINNEKRHLVTIDKNIIILTHDQFYESAYNLQTLHNITSNWLTLKLYREEKFINEGVIAAVSLPYSLTPIIIFYQLQPFYLIDKKLNQKLELRMILRNNKYIFKAQDKEVIDLKRDDHLDYLFNNKKKFKAIILPILPDILEESKEIFIEHGVFANYLDTRYETDVSIHSS